MNKTRLIALTIALGLVAVSAIAWFAGLSPRLALATDLNERAADLETANATLLARNKDLQDEAQALPELADEVTGLLSAVPRTADLPAILQEYPAAAKQAGLADEALTNLSTGLPQIVDAAGSGATELNLEFATIQTSVDVEGSPTNTLRFLANVQSMGRALLVSSTTFSQVLANENAGDETGGQVNISGSMFVLNSPLPDLVARAEAALEALEELESSTAASQPS